MKYYLPALLWAAVIFAVSSIPDLSAPELGIKFGDKIIHFFEYFILGFLTAYAVSKQTERIWMVFIISAAVSGVYGILDEIHQLFVPGRSTEGFDMLADVLGSILAAAIYVWWMEKRSSGSRRALPEV